MALLIKEHINQYGASELYWRIINININLQYKYVDITLAGYASKEARDSGFEPMNTKKVRAKWSEEEFDRYFAPSSARMLPSEQTNIYQVAYEYVKIKDEMFSEGVDV